MHLTYRSDVVAEYRVTGRYCFVYEMICAKSANADRGGEQSTKPSFSPTEFSVGETGSYGQVAEIATKRVVRGLHPAQVGQRPNRGSEVDREGLAPSGEWMESPPPTLVPAHATETRARAARSLAAALHPLQLIQSHLQRGRSFVMGGSAPAAESVRESCTGCALAGVVHRWSTRNAPAFHRPAQGRLDRGRIATRRDSQADAEDTAGAERGKVAVTKASKAEWQEASRGIEGCVVATVSLRRVRQLEQTRLASLWLQHGGIAMRRYGAEAYLVEVRPLNGRSKSNLAFGKFDGSSDLSQVLRTILQKYASYQSIPVLQRAFKVTLSKSTTYVISGFYSMGEYGTESDIINTTNGTASYKKKKHETDPTPFYFQLHLPPAETRGVLCIGKWGHNGVKTLLQLALSGPFEANYPNLRLHVRPLSVSDALQDYLKRGMVEEIIVEKYEIPADIADKFLGHRKTYNGVFSYSIKPKSRSLLKKPGLIAFAKGDQKLEDIYDFGDTGFDTVKVKIDINGKTKLVNLTKLDSISSTYDLTEDVTLGPDGYPTEASLAGEFADIVANLAKRGGIAL